MIKLIKFVFKSIVFIFTILVCIAVFGDSDDTTKSTTKETTASKPVVSTPVVDDNTTYFCNATTSAYSGYHVFTVDKKDKLISQEIHEDNADVRYSNNPAKNWLSLGNGKFKHKLLDRVYECTTEKTVETVDIRSQYMYASSESLLGYVKKRVKAEAGTSQVKFHSILGASYKTFPDWAPSKETLQGRVRYSVNITVTNIFGGKELYTAVVFADGSKVEEYTLYKGHR